MSTDRASYHGTNTRVAVGDGQPVAQTRQRVAKLSDFGLAVLQLLPRFERTRTFQARRRLRSGVALQGRPGREWSAPLQTKRAPSPPALGNNSVANTMETPITA